MGRIPCKPRRRKGNQEMSEEMSLFAKTVLQQRYAHDLQNGVKEEWADVARRVSHTVLKSVGAKKDLIGQVEEFIKQRKFIPGGRYLYATGRPYHQVQNCYGGETELVTREGTRTLGSLVGQTATIMTSEGHWVKAPILSFGIQNLRKVTLSRAGMLKEIWATSKHSWRLAKTQHRVSGRLQTKHPVTTEDLKEGQKLWSVYGYGISRTPVCLAGVQHGIVFGDGNVPEDDWGFNTANVRLCGDKDKELVKYFEGYGQTYPENDVQIVGLPRHYKEPVSLHSDRSYLLGWLTGYFAADGCVSDTGAVVLYSVNRDNLQLVKDVCYLLGIGAYGIRYQDRISNLTERESRIYSVSLMRQHLTPEFFLISEQRRRFENNLPKTNECVWSVVSVGKEERTDEVFCAVVEETHEFVLADNILTGNCLLMRAEDSREGWAELLQKLAMGLMTGSGIGVDYSLIREEGRAIRKTGGTATGPCALMKICNEAGRQIMQGGTRRSALWAGLSWKHPDIMKFITMKNWTEDVRVLKSRDFNFPATMDGTNISVQLDDEFFIAYTDEKHNLHAQANMIYWAVVERMLKTSEPGFSVDIGKNRKETLRNACTELTSEDDSDVCNLGSVNLARISSLEEMQAVVETAIAFLLAGTVYSDVPYAKVDMVRTINRRLGLGLMGIHEWLLIHGKKYEQDADLDKYLDIYATSTKTAHQYADLWELSHPIKTRAIAPTGTIGIIGETTTGLEPIFCAAFKRRYLKGQTWHYQYVLDPTAKRLIENHGVNPEHIEDAYVLAEDVERRLAFQAHLQTYVDHAISSTINLPQWGSESNNENTVQKFGKSLMKYLPQLRGITTYPDGCRSGQPLTPVKWGTAEKHVGEVFVEAQDVCSLRGGESCGS